MYPLDYVYPCMVCVKTNQEVATIQTLLFKLMCSVLSLYVDLICHAPVCFKSPALPKLTKLSNTLRNWKEVAVTQVQV